MFRFSVVSKSIVRRDLSKMTASQIDPSKPELRFYLRIAVPGGRNEGRNVLEFIKEDFKRNGHHEVSLELEIESIAFSINNRTWGAFVDRNFQEWSSLLLTAFGRYLLKLSGAAIPRGHRVFEKFGPEHSLDLTSANLMSVLESVSPMVDMEEVQNFLASPKSKEFLKEADVAFDRKRNTTPILTQLLRTNGEQAFINQSLPEENISFWDAYSRKVIAPEDIKYVLSSNSGPMEELKYSVKLNTKRNDDALPNDIDIFPSNTHFLFQRVVVIS